jgi:bleomycin hydrolase
MKKKILLALVVVASFSSVIAQTGSINPQNLEKIRKAYNDSDPATIALTNAISNNDVKNLALNRQNLGTIDHNFKYKADVKGITDQKSSGRCWMFTSLNVMRPLVIEKYKLSGFEFSQNYLYFWDMLEKANLFLEASSKYANKPMDDRYVEWLFKRPIGDGGVWSSFTNLATKYGLVPKEIMPETNTSENTRQLGSILDYQLRQAGLEIRDMVAQKVKPQVIEDKKIEVLGKVYRILALNLGEPPVTFNYRFVDKDKNLGETRTYTPLTFMNEVLGTPDFNQYIMLMNDPTRDYYNLYEIEYDRNVMEGRNWLYLNLPNDSIKKFALKSLIAKKPMYASCDVAQQLNSKIGYSDVDNYDYASLYGVDFKMNKAQRIKTFESGSSHGMALVAVDTDSAGRTIKWQFENSWGSSSGNNGYLTFTDEWFNEYMFRVVILKEFLSPATLKLLEQNAIMLPPWDPMFQADE